MPISLSHTRYMYDPFLPRPFLFLAGCKQNVVSSFLVEGGHHWSYMGFQWNKVTDSRLMSSSCLAVGVLGSCCLNKHSTPQYCEYYHGSRAQCDKFGMRWMNASILQDPTIAETKCYKGLNFKKIKNWEDKRRTCVLKLHSPYTHPFQGLSWFLLWMMSPGQDLHQEYFGLTFVQWAEEEMHHHYYICH